MPPTRTQLEGASLEELLGRVQREYGGGARIVQAEKVRSGGVGGFFAREVYRIEVELEAPPAAAAPQPVSLLDLADAVSDEEVAVTVPRQPAARRAPLSTEAPSFAAVLAGLAAGADDDDEFVALRRRQPAPRPKKAPAATPVVEAVEQAAIGNLRALPLPTPAALPATYAAGQVVAIVGDLPLALRAARAIALDVGIGEPDLFVASTDPARLRDVRPARRLHDPARLAAHRARWERRQDTTFVVVDGPLLLRPEGWARAVLEAAGASVVWGAVSATTKAADIELWSSRVGGVDALSVHDVAASADASDVLTGRLPVRLVDGVRPALPTTVRKWGVA